MRELKFRVWSEEDKEYRSDIKVSDLVVDIEGVPSTIYNAEGDRFDIEQYTGIKDMFGKKIFDGDIIRNLVYDCNSAVEQAPSGAWVAKDDKGEVYEVVEDIDHIKVIGNIHENPELLEAKNVY